MYFRFSDEAVFNRFRFNGRSFQLLGKLKDGKSLRLDFLTETIWKLMERSNEFNLVNKFSKERGSYPAPKLRFEVRLVQYMLRQLSLPPSKNCRYRLQYKRIR